GPARFRIEWHTLLFYGRQKSRDLRFSARRLSSRSRETPSGRRQKLAPHQIARSFRRTRRQRKKTHSGSQETQQTTAAKCYARKKHSRQKIINGKRESRASPHDHSPESSCSPLCRSFSHADDCHRSRFSPRNLDRRQS